MRLRDLKISWKLQVLTVVAVACLVTVATSSALSLRDRMLIDRQDKVQHIVEAVTGVVEFFDQEAKSGAMNQEQAQTLAKAAVRKLRYGAGGNEYFWIQDMTPAVVMHPIKPESEGKNVGELKDPSGFKLFTAFVDVVRKSGAGFVPYLWPKPGFSEPVEKISYVKGTAWGWIVGSGLYLDDVTAEFHAALIRSGLILLAGVALLVGAALWLARSLSHPLVGLANSMAALAAGDVDAAVPTLERKDEIGKMAGALTVFRDTAREARQLEAREAAARDQAASERKDVLTRLADALEETIRGVAQSVSASAGTLQQDARKMSDLAKHASEKSLLVSEASGHATRNVQTVAAAAEELSSSIAEINRQASDSTRITAEAVSEVSRTNATVEELAGAAQRIGEVVRLISDIASQTNLLALNATIEAARAGEAGKGFAVVATEVKSLANQTAQATEEISAQIAAMQAVSNGAVNAIKVIGGTIGRIDQIVSAISAAVRQQGEATEEIARNISLAASGTRDVADNIGGVTDAAAETGGTAGQLLAKSEELARQADTLRGEVDRFAGRIREA